MALIDILNQADYLDGGKDSRVWVPSQDGSFYLAISDTSSCISALYSIWKMRAPQAPKIIVFSWLDYTKVFL